MPVRDDEIRVVCISHKRPQCITCEAIANVTVAVAESEVASYRRVHPDVEFAIHPDSVNTGMAGKRNWVFDKFGYRVVMVDDDIEKISRFNEWNGKLPPQLAWEVIQEMASTAEEMQCKLFSMTRTANATWTNTLRPIRLTGQANGGLLGFLGDQRLRVPKKFEVGEDFYLSLMNAHLNRITYIEQRYALVTVKTMRSPGGLSAVRSMEVEARNNLELQRLFGSDVVRVGTGQVKIHGQQVSIRIPF